MTEIGSGGNYRIAVDTARNRFYIWYFGEVMRTTENPQLLAHTQEACRRLKPGFSVLADYLDLTMMGLPDVIESVQSTLLNSGVNRVATVWSADSFSKLVIDSQAQKVGDAYAGKRKAFTNRAEAETWLDGHG
jgi:hypothetical protein